MAQAKLTNHFSQSASDNNCQLVPTFVPWAFSSAVDLRTVLLTPSDVFY